MPLTSPKKKRRNKEKTGGGDGSRVLGLEKTPLAVSAPDASALPTKRSRSDVIPLSELGSESRSKTLGQGFSSQSGDALISLPSGKFFPQVTCEKERFDAAVALQDRASSEMHNVVFSLEERLRKVLLAGDLKKLQASCSEHEKSLLKEQERRKSLAAERGELASKLSSLSEEKERTDREIDLLKIRNSELAAQVHSWDEEIRTLNSWWREVIDFVHGKWFCKEE